jgi:hypothetical protein
MSFAISGIAQGLTQAAQSVAAGVTSAASTVAAGANAAASTTTQAVHGGGHHHHGGGGHLFQKIQQSVLSALQAQSQSTSNVSADQTVQSAIGQVLQARFSNANQTTDAESPDEDVDSNSVQQFFQKLQSYGVTPEQFRKDFLGAMQQSGQSGSNGQTTPVPLGLLVNLLA